MREAENAVEMKEMGLKLMQIETEVRPIRLDQTWEAWFLYEWF